MCQMWTPYDFHMKITLFLCGQNMVSIWISCGSNVDTMYLPHGHHMVSRWTPYGFYVDTMWFPCEHHVVSRWTPCGF